MRMALGAEPKDVLSLVLGKAAWTALTGLLLGIAGTVALQRIIAAELYGVSATDPVVLIVVSVFMGLVSLAAALLPALWAARVDPVVALRHE